MKKVLNVKNIAVIAILGSLAGILMIFDFPIMIAPSFYKLDFSDLPCIIGSFALGPVASVFIVVIKIIVKLLLKPTKTAFVGELAALIISLSYVVTAGLIYKKNKTKYHAIKALIVSSIVMAILATAFNYIFIIPFYAKLYHMPLESIIEMGNKIFPIVKDKLSFVLCCVFPFNIIKAAIVSVITLIIYKRISPLLK